MRAFLIRRLIGLVIVLVGISLLTFLLSHVMPADPARAALGAKGGEKQYLEMRERMGLDRSLPEQYVRYVQGLLQGDLGYSYTSRRPVATDLAAYFPASMELMLSALFLAVVVGVPLGVMSAARVRGPLDKTSGILAVFSTAMPLFLTGLLLQVIFYKQLGWLPAAGRIDIVLGEPHTITGMFTVDSLLQGDWPRFVSSVKHLILPAITLSLPAMAILIRIVRASMLESLGQEYVRTARSKGLSENRVVYGHALRNALLPTVTSLGMLVGALLSGGFLVEIVYTFPGLGMYVLNAIMRAEFAALISTTLIVATVYMVANLLVDIAYVFIDPRIRYA
ncbi:MAG: ABC transporter permease [Thermomicrobiales bacterium]